MPEIPEFLLWPRPEFAEPFAHKCNIGRIALQNARIAIVGLARNCAVRLAQNLGAIESLANQCDGWQLHIESNDCEDQTLEVLADFCRRHDPATFHYQVLGRGHFPGEFAGRRTVALAEYREACRKWVAACAKDSDYVVVIDFDLWGGWSHDGLTNAIGWLTVMPDAYGMASMSLFQHNWGFGPQWAQYDLWALRGVGQAGNYHDAYQAGIGGWAYGWFPPVGSQPVLVSSAFGGMAVYRTEAFLAGRYDGRHDCEHVPFHKSVAKATGGNLYICPAMRTLVHWMEPAECEATPQPSA